MRLHPGVERELAELAAYHAGLFCGAASRLDPDGQNLAARVAHGLFLLAEEAERRRREYLATNGSLEAAIAL
jgi:hypothetical protein